MLDDPRHIRADIALVGRAVRQRWKVPDEVRSEVPEIMRGIVNKPHATVISHDTGEPIQIDHDRERIAAAKVLVAMEQQNQVDDHAEDKVSRLNEGKPTEIVHERRLRLEFDDRT
jgi:hypothetical protein